ncbi:sirohydrochlorin chelatase [Streptomyces catenulae]|uniref:CbiX/SirB N-terminal domain-containing protein n=1 Tax=Streptomyces catenulae TaxID=66875 RepID=A0ABV2Z7Q1_9ACTN|nr:CbiX/SirB N-terminal domain-containing protein [Streptomyces catenulae]
MTASRSRTPLRPPGPTPYGTGGPGGPDGGWPGRGGPALVAVAHGSRDPRARPAVRALLARVRALRPGLPVRLGHLGLDRPLLADTLAGLHGGAVLVPLLFGHGHHVTHDLPAALAAAPHLDGRIAAPLGPHPLLAEALHGRLTEAGFTRYAAPGRPAHTAVVLAAAGSRAPRSAADTEAVAALLSARLGGLPVVPGYASAAAPTVTAAVRDLAARGHRRIAVAGCFAAPGRFATRCAADAPDTAAAPLGDHPALARLLLHRYDTALTAAGPAAPGHGTSATGRNAAGGDGSAHGSAGAVTVAV